MRMYGEVPRLKDRAEHLFATANALMRAHAEDPQKSLPGIN